jgi:hypothetical protein
VKDDRHDSPADWLVNRLAVTGGPVGVLFFPVYGAFMLGACAWALVFHPHRSWRRLNGQTGTDSAALDC